MEGGFWTSGNRLLFHVLVPSSLDPLDPRSTPQWEYNFQDNSYQKKSDILKYCLHETKRDVRVKSSAEDLKY